MHADQQEGKQETKDRQTNKKANKRPRTDKKANKRPRTDRPTSSAQAGKQTNKKANKRPWTDRLIMIPAVCTSALYLGLQHVPQIKENAFVVISDEKQVVYIHASLVFDFALYNLQNEM